MTEFDLIRTYFTRPGTRSDVVLGVGDDAALLRAPPDQDLVSCIDTLVAGVHFPHDTPAEALGHKALAVNLSDLAAMGATPAWITLSLTLPSADMEWVDDFSRGFHELADRHGITLVGGDTTRGPLSVTVQAMGLVPQGRALRRSGARVGDGIYVTGTLGDAALGLRHWAHRATADDRMRWLMERLMRPEPRVRAGEVLREFAHGAIDLSDGLVADLGHVLEASGTGARISLAGLPLSDAFRAVCGEPVDWTLPLAGGDDYELLFTLPLERESGLRARMPVAFSRIGEIEKAPGLRILDPQGNPVVLDRPGYRHFD